MNAPVNEEGGTGWRPGIYAREEIVSADTNLDDIQTAKQPEGVLGAHRISRGAGDANASEICGIFGRELPGSGEVDSGVVVYEPIAISDQKISEDYPINELDRSGAEEQLAGKSEGAWLLRSSSVEGQIAISAKGANGVIHVLLGDEESMKEFMSGEARELVAPQKEGSASASIKIRLLTDDDNSREFEQSDPVAELQGRVNEVADSLVVGGQQVEEERAIGVVDKADDWKEVDGVFPESKGKEAANVSASTGRARAGGLRRADTVKRGLGEGFKLLYRLKNKFPEGNSAINLEEAKRKLSDEGQEWCVFVSPENEGKLVLAIKTDDSSGEPLKIELQEFLRNVEISKRNDVIDSNSADNALNNPKRKAKWIPYSTNDEDFTIHYKTTDDGIKGLEIKIPLSEMRDVVGSEKYFKRETLSSKPMSKPVAVEEFDQFSGSELKESFKTQPGSRARRVVLPTTPKSSEEFVGKFVKDFKLYFKSLEGQDNQELYDKVESNFKEQLDDFVLKVKSGEVQTDVAFEKFRDQLLEAVKDDEELSQELNLFLTSNQPRADVQAFFEQMVEK